MSTVYAVEEHSGRYEDYRCYVNHIFSTSIKAQQYIDESREYWNNEKQHSDECRVCPLFDVDLDSIKNRELFVQKAKKKCSRFSIGEDWNFITCYHVNWDEDIPSFKIKEYEIE